MDLSTPIEQITGIGPVYQRRLKGMGIKTIHDLLFHFPHRYEDFSNIITVSQVRPNQNCCILGKIVEIKTSRTWKKRITLTQAIIEDKTGAIKVIWFNRPYLEKTLQPGEMACLAGRASFAKDGVYLSNPVYEKVPALALRPPDGEVLYPDLTHTGRLIPVYPETEGLSSRWLRFIIKPILIKLKGSNLDPLPPEIIKENKLLPFEKAVWQVHFPDSFEMVKKAQERFSFEQLFYISLFTTTEKMRLAREKATSVPINLDLIKRFVGALSFKLTDAQRKSAWQILKDMEKPYPMNRLLEGDVGSGKTVVAALAALNAIKARKQVTVMAPTEILSKQHFKTFFELFKNFNINIGLLTGKEDQFYSKKLKNQTIEISRKKLLEKTLNGDINILIGTHALISAGGKTGRRKKGKKISNPVKFGALSLVILDEQHRFGVEQRAALCYGQDSKDKDGKIQKRIIPHLLSMTATPIPRTLALTFYGDLDISLINELPKGRKKIITKIVSPAERKDAYEFIRREIKNGRQIFVICPRIGEDPEETIIEGEEDDLKPKKKIKKDGISDWSETKAVKEEFAKLSKEIFPDLKVEMLHGKMTPKEKEEIMRRFKLKKADILVSTSVIEVGIDIPNATVIMIEGAERFGLAQLHQFRGRVGRSNYQSYCFLLTDSGSQKTNQRLRALINCEDGFKLAEKDLEIRGPGDFSGTRQWGIPDLAMSALKDASLVEKARQSAKDIIIKNPNLKNFPQLLQNLERMREKIHLE